MTPAQLQELHNLVDQLAEMDLISVKDEVFHVEHARVSLLTGQRTLTLELYDKKLDQRGVKSGQG